MSWQRANTDWFMNARWGVFVHYLADAPSDLSPPTISVEEWNRQIDAFDVEGLADQLASVGAGYCFFTLGQNSGFFCSPNATYDNIVGHRPSRLSKRDLLADLAEAMTKRGIRQMTYLPSSAPRSDRRAVEALQCTPTKWNPQEIGFAPGSYLAAEGIDERLSVFQRHWEAIIREWSQRWSKKVHGWWIDGCYAADRMYRHPDAPNFRSFAEAMKAGNPDSLVAFNPGAKVPVICHSEFEDYTAGELTGDLALGLWRPHPGGWPYSAYERFIDGAQFHVLNFLGEWWCNGRPRFPEELVIGYTRYINQRQGVVTWDVPTSRAGLIPEPFMKQLAALGKAIGAK